jgi:hypothetical protein
VQRGHAESLHLVEGAFACNRSRPQHEMVVLHHRQLRAAGLRCRGQRKTGGDQQGCNRAAHAIIDTCTFAAMRPVGECPNCRLTPNPHRLEGDAQRRV